MGALERVAAMLVLGAVAVAAVVHGPETVMAVGLVAIMGCATLGAVHLASLPPPAVEPAEMVDASVGADADEAFERLFHVIGESMADVVCALCTKKP
jgi:hypothetical protein